jgi:hypothetical protein
MLQKYYRLPTINPASGTCTSGILLLVSASEVCKSFKQLSNTNKWIVTTCIKKRDVKWENDWA